jgi:DNA invertase Pin-like site-specific DNA recombinase
VHQGQGLHGLSVAVPELAIQGGLSNEGSTQLEAAIDILRTGDKLVVTKLDRLARSVAHMGNILEEIEAKGAGLVILFLGSETIDTSTATGKLVLNMMISVAQFER